MTSKRKVFQILLVEDNPIDIVVTKEALKRWQIDYQLHVVENGEAAMDFLLRRGDYIGAEKPHLIILDLNLPQKSGEDVLSEIRSSPELSTIPVVVMTTGAATIDFQICNDLGAKLFITKPMDVQDYIQTVCSIQEILE